MRCAIVLRRWIVIVAHPRCTHEHQHGRGGYDGTTTNAIVNNDDSFDDVNIINSPPLPPSIVIVVVVATRLLQLWLEQPI
jgi:hypothetical protein